ncbi:MAG: glycosyltransferase family 2 protein [Anaerolineales bacterium]
MNISVVIPLYNKEEYVYTAISSVLNQTVQPAEIVVVDDGSTDNSVNEVMKIKDARIHLKRQLNSGVSMARNRGVLEAQYDLVAFLDADDEWKPDFLFHIQRLYNNFPDCGAYATAYEISEEDGSRGFPRLAEIPPAPWIGIIPNLFKLMQDGLPFLPSSVAMPKTVFQHLKGFPEGIKQGEDKILWTCLGMAYPIAYSPSYQVVYHKEPINRACRTFEPEPAAANFIEGMLKNQGAPPALSQDLKDYYASLIIQKAQLSVKEGYTQWARHLLGRIKQNRKYRAQWTWWYIWSFVPYSFTKNVLRILSVIKRNSNS